jgi:hypothetical protein
MNGSGIKPKALRRPHEPGERRPSLFVALAGSDRRFERAFLSAVPRQKVKRAGCAPRGAGLEPLVAGRIPAGAFRGRTLQVSGWADPVVNALTPLGRPPDRASTPDRISPELRHDAPAVIVPIGGVDFVCGHRHMPAASADRTLSFWSHGRPQGGPRCGTRRFSLHNSGHALPPAALKELGPALQAGPLLIAGPGGMRKPRRGSRRGRSLAALGWLLCVKRSRRPARAGRFSIVRVPQDSVAFRVLFFVTSGEFFPVTWAVSFKEVGFAVCSRWESAEISFADSRSAWSSGTAPFARGHAGGGSLCGVG